MIKQFINWIRSLGSTKTKDVKKAYFEIEYCDDEPDVVDNYKTYLMGSNYKYWLVSLKCPCGCNEEIHLNLIKSSYPYWDVVIESNSLTIKPSVWRTKGCKSHFFIEKGVIKWIDY